MSEQLGFYVNLAKCTGCKACQIACKDKNDLPMGVVWRRVAEYTGGEWVKDGNQYVPNNVFTYYVSAACMHCEDALCMNVCPAAAIERRDDGIVLIDADKCIGCRYCEWACPYGAPQFDEERGVMTKCTLCADLIDAGEKPACVAGCTYRALDFGPISELREKYGDFDAPAPLPDPTITHPNVVFSPHPNAVPFDATAGQVLNPEEL